jgi:hypothetical protein
MDSGCPMDSGPPLVGPLRAEHLRFPAVYISFQAGAFPALHLIV